MEEMLRLIDRISKTDDHKKLINQLYKKLSEYKYDKNESGYLWQYLFPKIIDLSNKGIVHMDILYLSMLAFNNEELLKKLIEYYKTVLDVDIKNPTKLYDYCVLKKQHWFTNIISDDNFVISDKAISNDISILRLVETTNSTSIDVGLTKFLLMRINIENLDSFWREYVEQISYFIDFAEFAKSKSPSIETDDLLSVMKNNTSLQTFSDYLDLKTSDWKEILQWIHKEESLIVTSKTQSMNFVIFGILGNLLNCIMRSSNLDIHHAVQNIKAELLGIQNISSQVEVLENIFVLLFIHSNYFQSNYSNQLNIELICQRNEIRLILYLLKELVDQVKLKYFHMKDSEDYSRLLILSNLVADGMWRMELIENVKKAVKCENNLLKYMLSPPESLIQMCLKQGDFERAFQVMKICPLNNSSLRSDIEYAENIKELRDTLKKVSKIKAIHRVNPKISVSNVELAIDKIIEQFFKNNPTVFNQEVEASVRALSDKNDFFGHFLGENEIFMNMLDLAITQSQAYDDCEIMMQLAFENNTLNSGITSHYSSFCKTILELCKEIGIKKNIPAGKILLQPNRFVDIDKYKKEEEFYNNLAIIYNELMTDLNSNEAGYFNSKHSSHKSMLKLNKLCLDNSEFCAVTDNIRYLSKLYNYLRAFSRVLYIERNSSEIISKGKNTSYFDLLYFNRSELIGKLLFEGSLDPSEFEKYFGKLKLDYLYHVVGNCFPTINLHTDENVTKEELYPENSLYTPTKSIITYIQKRNWLLAFVLNEMYKVEGVKIDISEVRVKVFLNYLKLREIVQLKAIFNNNIIITALQNEINAQTVSDYVNSQVLKEGTVGSYHSQCSSDSFETGEELLEDTYKSTNWKNIYEFLLCIPECQIKKSVVLGNLIDMVLVNLIQDGLEDEYFKYVFFLRNRNLRINIILDNIKKWPGQVCIEIIQAEMTKFERLQDGKLIELKMWLMQINLCEKLKNILDLETWYTAYKMCEYEKDNIILKLLTNNEINVLLDFIEIHAPNEELLRQVDEEHISRMFEISDCYESVKLLLDALPFNHTVHCCYNLLKILRQIDHLKFITDYLLRNVNDDSLKNVEVSLKMLSSFTPNEQEQLLCLIHDPLNIIEILVMNTKLDKLASVLNFLKSEISHTEFSEERLSVEKIDEVLRKYAEKSLDFRVITQPNPRLLRTPEHKLMQSLDSLNFGSDSRSFVMPEEVPLKEDWVPNNEVLECMCCQKTVFSMFNRRHHCRRCGRVVCYNCSLQRMLVPTYGDILVRVCSTCYHQTMGESTSSDLNDTISTKSIAHDYWLLTDDPEHNKILREEFSYEHAPSVSLCLSLMKYHSKTVDYPKFLLDQCNVLLKLLQPSQEPIQEIDYLLVIKMLKTLAMAAKMSSIECTLHYGTSLADRILSQAELLSLLAERGCLSLLPMSSSYSQGPYIDASILRRLRDRLLEREQWNLALEVSTKAGLDNSGVFAVWGKSCLKAGSLILAREKFQRCLDRTGHYDNLSDYSVLSDSSENLSRSRNMSKVSNISALSESKPAKNPPLLTEIIHILESNTRPIDPEVIRETAKQKLSSSTNTLNQSFSSYVQTDSAVSIMNKLKNLKNISAGNYYPKAEQEPVKSNATKPPVHKIFYDECIYYLSRYGSHTGLLEFYVKHGDIDLALNYIIDNQLGTEVFIDIYMRCLKDGIIGILHEHISLIDSTLELWKEYLRSICRHLEKQKLLHSLYQLQQFMGDYIRAAMTCIRFYQENADTFKDLVSNTNFLLTAEEHLKQGLEQEQWVEVATVRKLSNASKASFEEKGISNPSLVMKINSKDVNKHMNTIWRQNEVVEFLANCERQDVKPIQVLKDILKPQYNQAAKSPDEKSKIPTLFGPTQEKVQLAVLVIVCGKQVEEGFGIALRIIQDLSLKPMKVYCEAGKQLAKEERYGGIAQLVSCIKQSGTSDAAVTDMCDEMLTLAVATLTKANFTGTKVEDLIKLISDKAIKISAYIEAKQLKTAYFLAVKYKRISDIRRIMREAELLNQPSIKALCQKVLQSHSHTPTHSKD
ncbi:unnamed protein product [Phaedon cochleariae]|uniref:FYVE zinc finger domain-containing protein n=1 Tax=Phaedon cochleariae TaxID=80249 RepID=A0A9P0DKY1_PHACE|nr:unnamed protein product [Phaedon cochleariae]